MSDRGQPGVDGPPACPFIAFEDERDERSPSPDHRHRCFAEVTPAPRALAHQEAYCLSSAFPVCPTFQDWARREAAHTRAGGRTTPPVPPAGASVVAVRPEEGADQDMARDDVRATADEPPIDEEEDDLWSGTRPDAGPPARRNPPRDWAAPPPWATGAAAGAAASSAGSGAGARPPSSPSGGSGSGSGGTSPDFLASRSESAGLAGSAADRIASGQPGAAPKASPPSDDLAGLVAPVAAMGNPYEAPLTRPPSGSHPTTAAAGRRPTVSSTRSKKQPDHDGPSWETAKRYEAYPTIKTRARLPGIPRIAVLALVIGIAAVALFFLPDLFDFGGGGAAAPSASPTASVVESAEPSDTPIPEPTAETYTIKKGDTLLKIAKKYKLTVDELLAANKATIKDPNKIKVGQVIVIPAPITDQSTDSGATAPAASGDASSAP